MDKLNKIVYNKSGLLYSFKLHTTILNIRINKINKYQNTYDEDTSSKYKRN